jgi:hypothetical protein
VTVFGCDVKLLKFVEFREIWLNFVEFETWISWNLRADLIGIREVAEVSSQMLVEDKGKNKIHEKFEVMV